MLGYIPGIRLLVEAKTFPDYFRACEILAVAYLLWKFVDVRFGDQAYSPAILLFATAIVVPFYLWALRREKSRKLDRSGNRK